MIDATGSPDPIQQLGAAAIGRLKTPGATGTPPADFQQALLDSLDQVNRLQREASAGVEKLMTGQSRNAAEVFSAVRKADIAFSMMMEIRNKLVEAYRELQQMRV